MDKFKLIKKFSRELTSTLDLEQLAKAINSFAVVHLGAEYSSIILAEGGKHTYNSKSSQIFDEVEKHTFKYVMKVGKCLRISNPKAEYVLKDIQGIKSFNYFVTSLPLSTKNQILGSLNLYFNMPYDDDFLDFLFLFAELSASSIMNSLAHKNLGKQSITDKLTGLYNRRNFDSEVSQQIEQCSDSNVPFSVMMIDIDGFKEYNDLHGHQEGDSILSYIGKTIKSLISERCMAFRYGGEELAVIVQALRAEDAFQLAEKIRNEIESSGKITVSIGLVTCRNSSSSPSAMVSEADKALYKAKKAGKNRVHSSIIIDKAINPIDVQEASEIGKP